MQHDGQQEVKRNIYLPSKMDSIDFSSAVFLKSSLEISPHALSEELFDDLVKTDVSPVSIFRGDV